MGQIFAQVAEGVWMPEVDSEVLAEEQERLELLGLRARTARRVREVKREDMEAELRRVRKEELGKFRQRDSRIRGLACYMLGGAAFLGAMWIYCSCGDLGLTSLPVIAGGLLCRWIK